MTALEMVDATTKQMTAWQEWVIKHDATAKYIGVVLTAMFILMVIQALGLLP